MDMCHLKDGAYPFFWKGFIINAKKTGSKTGNG